MPATAARIADELKVPEDKHTWESIKTFGGYPNGIAVKRCEPIFPRIDVKNIKEEAKKEKSPKAAKKEEKPVGLITIEDFGKVEMRVAQVLACEKHPDADKLLVFQLDFGGEQRQIISGIAKYYQPEALIGKKVIACTNLKPVILRGLESNGMILSAVKGKKLAILTVDGDVIPAGGKVG